MSYRPNIGAERQLFPADGWVHDGFVGAEDHLRFTAVHAAGVWLCWLRQVASHWLLASAQRRAMIESAPGMVQCMPDCLSLCPTTVLQLASTTPEPTNRD